MVLTLSIYKLFSRACRTNYVDLFIYELHEITAVFFVTNNTNYFLWMVKYARDLINMEDTHPGVRQLLKGGSQSVRRTNNSFSGNPVVMTLEQTTNANVASKLTVISTFQQNIAAKNKEQVDDNKISQKGSGR